MIKTLYPPFQKWSSKGSVYIISDTHFDDPDCLYMDKGWLSPEKHIQQFQRLTKNDTLIHLGDVGNPQWIKAIPGYKVLIMGNHDTARTTYERYRDFEYDFPTIEDAKKALQCGDITHYVYNPCENIYKGFVDNHLFDEVYTGPLIIAEKIILSHEPVDIPWIFNIHGHQHNKEIENDNLHFNCASNVVNYQMIDLKKLIQSGILKNVTSLHRQTIDDATLKKNKGL